MVGTQVAWLVTLAWSELCYYQTILGLNVVTECFFGLGVQEGIWVVGLITNSVAAGAGMEQGDRILAVNGVEVGSKSAFQVASVLQGDGRESSDPKVTLKVST